jgi:hypothetical protein
LEYANLQARVLTSDENDPEIKLTDRGLQQVAITGGSEGNIHLHLDTIAIEGVKFNATLQINVLELMGVLLDVKNMSGVKALLEEDKQ